MPADEAEARGNLTRLIAERREDLTGLSRDVLVKAPGYLGRYIREGSPRRLAEGDARELARYFRVEPQLFGVPLDEAPERARGAMARRRDEDADTLGA
jgi:hypothetical protein